MKSSTLTNPLKWSAISRTFAIAGVMSLLAIAGFSQAAAAGQRLSMFGHDIEVIEDDFLQKLSIDGYVVLKDQMSINLDEMVTVSGVPVVIGRSNMGGNACEEQRFILSFPQGKKPLLDGPVDSCLILTVTPKPDKIEFSAPANLTMPGKTWEWTVEGGLKKTGEIPYQPEQGGGWVSLRERKQNHPFDVLKLEEIRKQVEGMIGGDTSAYMQIMQGTGSGEFDGNRFFGTSCAPHSCGSVEGLLVADGGEKKLYLAWKEEGKKIKVSPNVKEWPDFARSRLKTWASTWK